MPGEFKYLSVVLLVSTGFIFIFVGWFMFGFMRLDPEQAKKTTGKLVGFRKHFSTVEFSSNYADYQENGPGRVPVIVMNIDGELYEISAAAADYSLTENDIGKQIAVRYQEKFGVVVLVDNDKSIHNYLQLKRILFGSFLSVGLILIGIGGLILLLF